MARIRRALVTGGAGFIGSHLVRRLLNDGWQVYVVDNLSTGHLDNVPAGAEFQKLDLSSPSSTRYLPVGVDVVFHLAAQSSGEVSFARPDADLQANSRATLLLLDWCRTRGITRFLFASSMAVYGDTRQLPVREDMCPAPKSFYGIHKLASEHYLRVFQKLGLCTTALRLFNVYGPGQNLANLKQGMVSIYLSYVVRSEPVLVRGSAARFRDFVFVDDVVEAFIACLDRPSTCGGIYNVGSGTKTTVGELLTLILQACGRVPDGYPVIFAGGTPGDQHGIYADCTAICRDTGWRARTDLRTGLRRMAVWALGRPDHAGLFKGEK
jgi:UDP-glucose 4-epimerase